MRKNFTLFFASLFLTLGAWAQTPVLTYENITAPQELSANDAATIRAMEGMTIVADVEITNTSDPSLLFTAVADYTSNNTGNNSIWGLGFGGNQMRYIVGPRSGGWYSNGSINTSAKKIAYTYNGSKIRYYVDGSFGGEVSSTQALNTFSGDNAKFYLGGVVYNTNTEWGKFNGTISKVKVYNSVFTDTEILKMCADLPEGFVANLEEIENGKIYTFTTSRGWMGASETENNAISTALAANNVTGSKENTYFQWSVYKSDKNNYYIYNVGKGMFLGEQSTDKDAIVPMSDTPAKVTFQTTNKSVYPFMFKTTDNTSCVINHSTQFGKGLITWNGGWEDKNDDGNCHQIVLVGDLDNNVLTTIKNAVEAYEADNTEAVAALDAAIAKAEAMAKYIGTGVGKYSTSDTEYATKFAAIKAFRAAIKATNTPTPAEVEAKTAEVEALIASFTLNMPEAGKYYTFSNGDYYITGNTTEDGTRIALSTTNDINTIYYFDGEHLRAYNTDRYMGLNATDWTFEAEDSEDISVVTFVASSAVAGAYNINCGSRWLHKDNGFVNRCGSNTCGAPHAWIIEEVTVLPEKPGQGGETGIDAVEAEEEVVIYDLTGRRVEKMEKGIYIVNGRKVVIK